MLKHDSFNTDIGELRFSYLQGNNKEQGPRKDWNKDYMNLLIMYDKNGFTSVSDINLLDISIEEINNVLEFFKKVKQLHTQAMKGEGNKHESTF